MPAVHRLAIAALLVGVVAESSRADLIPVRGSVWAGSSPSGLFANVHVPASTPTAVPTPTAPIVYATTPAPVADPSGSAPAATPILGATPASVPSSASVSTPAYDAFVNLGTGPYPEAGFLTTGTAQWWANSSEVAALYGGRPTADQRAAFGRDVIARVQQTFALSGIPVHLTTDPNASAAHTLSVVSNTVSGWLPTAIGMTDIGGSGFHFIDNAARLAQTPDQLAWIVAHNVSHELMLAFGVPENYDQSGRYIDATVANWSMMVDPNATFSPGAAQALLAENFLRNNANGYVLGAQLIGPSPVPEPSAIALWTVAGLVGLGARLRAARTRVRA